ncbi:MAG: hypothetical protein ACYDHG_16260 [Desulfomonilaceae bacterium]
MLTRIPVKEDVFKELLPMLVTFGVTLGGFFLTALSIIAGFSSTPFVQRLLQAPKLTSQLTDIFLIVVVLNMALAIVSLAAAVVPSSVCGHLFIWTIGLSLLFLMSLYFAIYGLYLFRSVIRGIIGFSRPSPISDSQS